MATAGLAAWEVVEKKRDRVVLKLRSKTIPPFDYEATQVITLAGATFEIELRLKHHGMRPIPYGLGQHPWFVRTPGRQTAGESDRHVAGAAAGISGQDGSRADPAEVGFFARSAPCPTTSSTTAMPAGTAAPASNGPIGGSRPRSNPIPRTRYCHVYSLGKDCPIFCFEPVTHPNNALGKPGTPEANGLRVLAPGAETSMLMRLKAAFL